MQAAEVHVRACERRLHQHVDFVVCLGGDGTILHASSLFQAAIPPIVSFSAGSLGFLTNHSLAALEADLRAVIYGCEDLGQCSLEEEVRILSSATFSLPCYLSLVRIGAHLRTP
jgi:NAD kinase